jgi:hypothetical protein
LAGEKLAASDVLLPELSLEGLLGAEGKLLVLFFARRCQQVHIHICEYIYMHKEVCMHGSVFIYIYIYMFLLLEDVKR